MNTEMKNALVATDGKNQYDYQVKRLLANKWILAHILIKVVKEFRGMSPAEVVSCIEGEPMIGIVPVEPGLTNAKNSHSRIVGFNTENIEIGEGMIRFDIVCYVRLPDGLSQIIVNVEGQKSEPADYDIMNRAIFYGCRMISSQKERDFENTEYNDIKRVFSVWICMNMEECVLNYIHLTDERWMGDHEWKGMLDLLNIIFIGLTKELPEEGTSYELHRLLTALLLMTVPLEKKQEIIENEYRIPMESDLRKGVAVMCNLSEGIWESGVEQGTESLIIGMYEDGISVEQIARISKKTAEEVQQIIDKKRLTEKDD